MKKLSVALFLFGLPLSGFAQACLDKLDGVATVSPELMIGKSFAIAQLNVSDFASVALQLQRQYFTLASGKLSAQDSVQVANDFKSLPSQLLKIYNKESKELLRKLDKAKRKGPEDSLVPKEAIIISPCYSIEVDAQSPIAFSIKQAFKGVANSVTFKFAY
jgi:hypothetical protein